MKTELWRIILYPILAAIGLGVGWFGKDLQLNGVVGATEPTMVGGLTVTGLVTMFFGMYSAWKAYGGRIDGKITDKDVSALAKLILERLNPKLDDALAPIIDKAATIAAPVLDDKVGKLIPGGVVTATRLLDWIEEWYKDDKQTANESALLNTFLDKLSDIVKDDKEGTGAAATLRARLHAVMNQTPSIAVV